MVKAWWLVVSLDFCCCCSAVYSSSSACNCVYLCDRVSPCATRSSYAAFIKKMVKSKVNEK